MDAATFTSTFERIKQQMEADYLPGSAVGAAAEGQAEMVTPAEYSAYQLGQIRKDIARIADALTVAVSRMNTRA